MKVGIDVSTWQKKIDYSIAREEIDFIIPRTGFAQTTDNMYRTHVQKAIENAIQIPAVYHFSYALSVQDAIAEADYAISEVAIMRLPKSTIIFYDYEYDSMNYAKKKGITVTRQMVNDFTNAFCNRCIEKGYPTGIYLNNDYYKNIYFPTTVQDKRYVIWLADWTGGPDHPCYIQQYTSKGIVSGVEGNVDMNYLFDDADKPSKSLEEIAREVLAGKWGNGPDRKVNLENAGYNYLDVQNTVNKILTADADTKDKVPTHGVGIKLQRSDLHTGEYCCLEDEYMRQGSGDNKYALVLLPKGTHVYCSGFYDVVDDEVYIYCHATPFENGMVYAGFVKKSNVKTV